jgi:hypothetical protein
MERRVTMTPLCRILPVAAAAAALLLLSGCKKDLPAAPSELTSGVTIYEHANFMGASALLTADVRDLKDFNGPCVHYEWSGTPGGSSIDYDWNDCVSSLKVAPGWRATIYRDDDFKGESFAATGEVPNLQLVRGSCDHDGLNDCITSIRIGRQ